MLGELLTQALLLVAMIDSSPQYCKGYEMLALDFMSMPRALSAFRYVQSFEDYAEKSAALPYKMNAARWTHCIGNLSASLPRKWC